MKKLVSLSILLLLCIYSIKIGLEQQNKDSRTYNVPTSEVAEKIEYIHKLDSMPDVSRKSFGELGMLPRQGAGDVLLYLVEENKILFLPEDFANSEIMINNEPCKVYYSEEAEGYLFYFLKDWGLSEEGVPINSVQGSSIAYCTVGVNGSGQEYGLAGLRYLGMEKINFDAQITKSKIIEKRKENEYINVLLEYISKTLRGKEKYGSYDIYVYRMERIASRDQGTNCLINAVIVGSDMKEYGSFIIYDNGDIEGIFPLSGPALEDTGYFTDEYQGEKYEYLLSEIMELSEDVVHLEILKGVEEDIEKEEEYFDDTNYEPQIDFHSMSVQDAAEWIEYVCSYCEWFGINELGYKEGEIRGFNGKKIVMYAWKNRPWELLFIPLDKVNLFLKRGDGTEYPVYINGEGKLEFYGIEENPYVSNEGQLKTTFITSFECAAGYISEMSMLGEAVIVISEFSEMHSPIIEADEYTIALEKYVESMLMQYGKSGTYDIQIGEYEALHTNKVCISAAVVGEKEYYVRYLIVKYGENEYYFWPVGFGLDGSLEECSSERHKMNEICIERIKQLKERKVSSIVLD